MSQGFAPSYTRPLALLAILFFMWGFLTSMNDILIPYLREAFGLNDFQSMLVQLCFFGGYFVGALIYFVISVTRGDPIARIGYQRGMVIGLLITGLGAFLFYPAADRVSYGFFLAAYFVLGFGLALVQISANPYVAVLGSEKTASSRLNLSQGFNSLGTVLGPLIGGYLIFEVFARTREGDASAPQVPYLVFGGALILLAVLFSFVSLPKIGQSDRIERGMTALRYPQLAFGVIAIFLYVGAEVSIGSILIRFFKLPEIAGLSELEGSAYVAVYWGGLMIGRFLGAISLSRAVPAKKVAAMLGIPIVGFLLLALALDVALSKPEGGGDIAYNEALSLMLPYAVVGAAVLLVVALLADGKTAMWCVIAVGLFNSVMWSNIFALAIEGLGRHTSQGSSLLVMAIFGGAIIPPLQGRASDVVGHAGPHLSMWVPAIAYVYIAWYGAKGHALRREVTS
ncbi:MAG: sugar MFS transporter [Planctomycetota bacterium]|jgi:FHS family L-fucose permease-like MFS transporter